MECLDHTRPLKLKGIHSENGMERLEKPELVDTSQKIHFIFGDFFSIIQRGCKKSSFIPTFNILINNLNELKSHFHLINDNIYTLYIYCI